MVVCMHICMSVSYSGAVCMSGALFTIRFIHV